MKVNENIQDDLKLLTVNDVAKMMRVGVATIWRWAKNGSFPQPIKVGGATRWRARDLQKFLENQAA